MNQFYRNGPACRKLYGKLGTQSGRALHLQLTFVLERELLAEQQAEAAAAFAFGAVAGADLKVKSWGFYRERCRCHGHAPGR